MNDFVGAFLVAGVAAVLGFLFARRSAPVNTSAAVAVEPHDIAATLQTLIQALDARDPSSRGHARRVQAGAMEIGRTLGLDPEGLRTLRLAALLHDVGKVVVPEHVLCKPGRLSDAEFEKVKEHPQAGVAILAPSGLPEPVLEIIRHHHERWDGHGYPEGRQGTAIPIGARILAVADAFESLTSERAWRGRLPPGEAAGLIETWSGVQFDPEIVAVVRGQVDAIASAMQGASAPGPRLDGSPSDLASAAGAAAIVPEPDDPGGFGALLHQGVVPARSGVMPAGAPAPRALFASATGVPRDAAAAQREVYALYEIARTLGSSLRLTDVLDLVVSKLAMLVPFRTCVVHLVSSPGELQARFVSGANAAPLRGRRLRFGEGITGWAATHRTSRFDGGAQLDLAGTEVDAVAYSTVAAFPLVHADEVLGVITVYFPANAPCLDDHVRVMEILARLASGAIHEGRLGLEEGEAGLSDRVTHLPNERYLRQAFSKEIVRSQQSGQPLSVVEMDLEDFAAVNRRHGREAGDRLLMEVGRVLRSHLRERDVLVRLGEDEYAALLPGTGFAAAALLTERLQQAVDGFALRLGEGDAARAGLSVGIAIYPLDGEGVDDLLQRASLNRARNRQARRAAREAAPNVVPFRPTRD
ncbi:MAG TPA: HD domain-containing phosphohydrolase [Candidatus Polarisedimenticolia bacterium]|nr:HD domain-containing phosphohydrolase [Candidatus Polarisedimenticolia bacterium]